MSDTSIISLQGTEAQEDTEKTERIKAGEWKRILTGKGRIESLGGNWSGFKIKLREVRDWGREGKRETTYKEVRDKEEDEKGFQLVNCKERAGKSWRDRRWELDKASQTHWKIERDRGKIAN